MHIELGQKIIDVIRGKDKKFFLYKKLRKKILNTPYDLFNKKKLTKEFLNFIEVEVFSFCNRQCWFCPNSIIDRHSNNIFMPEDTYLNLLSQLKEINYEGLITYSRYNEPMSNKDIIITRIKQAREYLPNAFLYTHSNGDYLNENYIYDLADAGLNHLRIQCYLDKNEEFNIENVVKPKMQKIINRLNIPIKENINETNKNHYVVELILPEKYQTLNVIIESTNFSECGVNRGESIDTIKGTERTNPCLSPFYRMYIDYDGSVMPCCQVRHDIPKHSHMILGNINKDSIFNIFFNEKYIKIRNLLINHGNKINPCSSCSATSCESVFDEYGIKHVYEWLINKNKVQTFASAERE